jgi:hypothetical protein
VRPGGSRAFDDRLHDLLMTEMKPVKNAQRQNRRAKMLAFSVPWNIFISTAVLNLTLLGR